LPGVVVLDPVGHRLASEPFNVYYRKGFVRYRRSGHIDQDQFCLDQRRLLIDFSVEPAKIRTADYERKEKFTLSKTKIMLLNIF
jgi:hypothetical protein